MFLLEVSKKLVPLVVGGSAAEERVDLGIARHFNFFVKVGKLDLCAGNVEAGESGLDSSDPVFDVVRIEGWECRSTHLLLR